MTKFSIIVAVDENNGIGINNQLPWHISEDMKHFKSLTVNKVVLMGLNTWYSLPIKPLPKRINIVVSFEELKLENGVKVCNSIEEAINYCYQFDEVFIIGGKQLYRQFFPLADKLYLTKIHHKFETDTQLEGLNPQDWIVQKEEFFEANEKRPFSFSFLEFIRCY